jgi:hypothetical protein
MKEGATIGNCHAVVYSLKILLVHADISGEIIVEFEDTTE